MSVSFGQWLKQRRKALELTQENLAQCVGCSLTLIQKIEAGTRRPSLQIAKRLGTYLDIPHDYLPAFLQTARPDIYAGEMVHAAPHTPPSYDSNQARPVNLPAQPVALLGRVHEISAIRQLILSGKTRLLTITGPAGVGKTSLAIAAAAGLGEDCSAAIWFCDLIPANDPVAVLRIIAQIIGVRDEGNEPPLERLITAIQHTPLLLLLDNFEHVSAAAPLLAQLLVACPHVKLLVTSRVPLHLRWEHLFPVPMLPLPAVGPKSTIEAAMDSAAVALFVERAQAIKPAFRLTEDTVRAVAEVCIYLDGLPLAIELAAARISVLSVHEIRDRLSSRLALLVKASSDLPVRQRTLRDAIDWSYQLLTPEERDLFMRLGVFVGTWTLEAATEVCTESIVAGRPDADVPALLDTLVDKNLVQRQERHGVSRFRLLETLREYAIEQLKLQADHEEVRRRHGRYYLSFAEAAMPELVCDGLPDVAEMLEGELDNLRAAFAWALVRSEAEFALRLCAALRLLWRQRHLSEGRRWVEQALALPLPTPRSYAEEQSLYAAQAPALLTAGLIDFEQGYHFQARAYFTRSLDLYRRLEDPQGCAIAFRYIGETQLYTGDVIAAQHSCEESLAIYLELNHTLGIALMTQIRASILLERKAYAEAEACYRQSLAAFRSIGIDVANLLINLGKICFYRGDYRGAADGFAEALALCRKSNNKRNLAIVLTESAFLSYHQDDPEQTYMYASEALSLFFEMEHLWGIATILSVLAATTARQRLFARAALLCGAVEACRSRINAQLFDEYEALYTCAGDAARGALDTTTFIQSSQAGRNMSLEQIVAYAQERVEAVVHYP